VLGGERGHSLALYRAVPSLLRARRLRGGGGSCAVYRLCLGSEAPGTGTGRRAVGHLNKSLRAVLATQTRLVPYLHPCVHALAARAGIELPGWASRGPAVRAAAGISSWRALSAASWRRPIRSARWPPACTTPAGGPGGLCAPRRCALVALRSRSVERLLSGRKKSRDIFFSAKFDTVHCVTNAHAFFPSNLA